MPPTNTQTNTIDATVNAPTDKAGEVLAVPAHIIRCNAASHDWHFPRAENDLKADGRFKIRMEAKTEALVMTSKVPPTKSSSQTDRLYAQTRPEGH